MPTSGQLRDHVLVTARRDNQCFLKRPRQKVFSGCVAACRGMCRHSLDLAEAILAMRCIRSTTNVRKSAVRAPIGSPTHHLSWAHAPGEASSIWSSWIIKRP